MKAVAYCRFSSENQRDGYSVDAQMRAIKEYCAREGVVLINNYIDEARSGTSDNRESFQRMIRDAAKKDFKMIIVHKLDRFARDRYDSAVYKKKLKDLGIRLVSVLEPLDNSPESVMMESVLEGMAEYYSRNLSREVKKGKDEAARQGLWNGGVVPYGFDVVDSKYMINEKEAAFVRSIFEKFLAGANTQEIADWMNENGQHTRKGKIFKRYSIHSILGNPHYTGVLHHGRNRDELIKVRITDPIISKEIYEAVQNKFAKRKNGPISRTKESIYLLTGVLYCGECGSHLRGHKSKKKYTNKKGEDTFLIYRSYRCAGTAGESRAAHRFDKSFAHCTLKGHSKTKLEDFVIDSIHKNVFSDEGVELITKRIIDRNKARNSTDKLKDRIRYLQNKKDRLLDLFLDGNLDKNAYNKKLNELDTEVEKLKTEVEESGGAFGDADYIKVLIKKFLNSSTSSSSIEYKQLLISVFIDSVYIDNEKIVINYKFEGADGGIFSDKYFVPNGDIASARPLQTETLMKSTS